MSSPAQPLQTDPVTAYSLAARYLGLGELHGDLDNPHIRAWLSDCGLGPEAHDETPWCAAFVRHVAWLLGLPLPSYPARARSWLTVGQPVPLDQARQGWDIVILARSAGPWPGPETLAAPGHVGWFTSASAGIVRLLGGNQGNRVSLAPFDAGRVLGVRRLA